MQPFCSSLSFFTRLYLVWKKKGERFGLVLLSDSVEACMFLCACLDEMVSSTLICPSASIFQSSCVCVCGGGVVFEHLLSRASWRVLGRWDIFQAVSAFKSYSRNARRRILGHCSINRIMSCISVLEICDVKLSVRPAVYYSKLTRLWKYLISLYVAISCKSESISHWVPSLLLY